MADDFRTCRRAGCRWPAAASLSYQYATRQVWLLDLTDDAHPSVWDLCPDHATALTVPRGWERVDQRTAEPVPAAPPREAPGGHAPPEPVAVRVAAPPTTPAPSRYAALRAELPRLAAQWAAVVASASEAQEEPPGAGAGGATAGAKPAATQPARHRSRLLPSRELAPVTHDGFEPLSPADDLARPAPTEIPGQLAIPEPVGGGGVVVHLDRGARRRSE